MMGFEELSASRMSTPRPGAKKSKKVLTPQLMKTPKKNEAEVITLDDSSNDETKKDNGKFSMLNQT